MRIRITHDTTYTYSEPVSAAIQLLRLTPRGHDGQRVIAWNIETDCKGRLIKREDWYGNIMHSLYASGPIDHIGLKVVGEVETTEVDGIIRGGPERFPEIFYLRSTTSDATRSSHERVWEGIRRADRVGATKRRTPSWASFMTGCDSTRRQRPQPRRRAKLSPRDTVSVRISRTSSLRLPVMPGCRRAMCPGYLHKEGEFVQQAGHAWAEVFVSDLGWVSFDATNGVCATEHYVRLATGLDYLDAAPVRGTYYGVSREDLDVSLRIEGAGQSQTQ